MAGLLLNRSRQVPAEETPAFGGIAERFRRAGDLDRAIALCRDGLKRFPNQLSARVTLGWALLDKGQFDEARLELEQVLRRAPDNLAAIRGLAEIHDRTEGALPSDEREWRPEETVAASADPDTAGLDQAESIDVGTPLMATPEVDDHPVGLREADADAPLQVSFASGDTPVEIVRTDDHSAFAASTDTPIPLDIAPVETEAPSAAALNPVEPIPFVVDEPVAETSDVPVAFELDLDAPAVVVQAETGDAPVEEFEGFESQTELPPLDLQLQAEEAAVLDLGPGALDEPAGFDVLSPAEQADQTVPVLESLTGGHDATFAIDETPASDLVLEVDDLEAELTMEPATEAGATDDVVVEAVAIEPEALEDIDEEAGQELADAIRALEEASRRVEARLALRPVNDQPAASADVIGAVDLDADTGAAEDSDARPVIDSRHDGAFELTQPGLGELPLEEISPVDDLTDDASGLAAVEEEAVPRFDFDHAVDIADVETLVDSLEESSAQDGELVPVLPDLAGGTVDREPETAWAEPADATEDVASSPFESDQVEESTAALDVDQEPGSESAGRLDEVEEPVEWLPAAAASIEVPAPDRPGDFVVAAAATALVHDALAPVFDQVQPGQVTTMVHPQLSTRQQVTIAALERFLRKVQARRLELQSEPVA